MNVRKKDKLAERDNYTCLYCGRKYSKHRKSLNKKTIDHLIPRKHRGSNEDWNCTVMHYWCNQRKGSKMIGKFIRISEANKIKVEEENKNL